MLDIEKEARNTAKSRGRKKNNGERLSPLDAEPLGRLVLPNTPEEPIMALAIHQSPSVRCGLSLTGHSGAPSSAPKNRFRSRASRRTLL